VEIMNKNIILGIVAAGIVIGALYLLWDNDIITPIDEANFSGSWKQTVVVSYADGTSKTIDGTDTATITHDGSPITMIKPYLYINPTSDSTPGDVDIDIELINLYYTISDTAIDGSTLELVNCDVGFRPFSVNAGFQEVGRANIALASYEGLGIIPYNNDYTLTMWYEGVATYRTPSIDNTEYTTPAPVGELIFEFSSIQGATIINFEWNPDIEVS